jgi:hypothetical protein
MIIDGEDIEGQPVDLAVAQGSAESPLLFEI